MDTNTNKKKKEKKTTTKYGSHPFKRYHFLFKNMYVHMLTCVSVCVCGVPLSVTCAHELSYTAGHLQEFYPPFWRQGFSLAWNSLVWLGWLATQPHESSRLRLSGTGC